MSFMPHPKAMPLVLLALGLTGASAHADTATYTSAPVSGCPTCVAKDTTGLVVQAQGQLYPTGWTVKTSANGLYVANRQGATFTLPGKTFDLTGFKLFAKSLRYGTSPVTYTLYAFHPGNPIADMVQITVNSAVVRTLPISDSRLTNLSSLDVRFSSDINYTYFIETNFKPH
ncbi:hypothetical protein [Oryzibacter oryziterrae]|uniref:hypothetical protein n=1 Tax=Oryzibacter oryziterrae TaxID=2766474 RepID=UPI001F417A3C|nr:hypothetical protein [Oryzibacter oryziterrae]